MRIGSMEKLTLTITEAAQLLGISRTTAYELARQGKIPVLRLGKRLVVPKAALERMLEGNRDSSPSAS